MLLYFKELFSGTLRFFRDSGKSFRQVIFFHFVMIGLVVPLLLALFNLILSLNGIHQFSYIELISLLLGRPLALISLLILFILTLAAVFAEFTFLLLLSSSILQKKKVRLSQLFRVTIKNLRKLRPSSLLFFFLYFLLILPLGGLAGNVDILSTIKVPDFVVEFLAANHIWLYLSFVILVFACIYIAYRLIFVLPLMILRGEHLHVAFPESWRLTKSKPRAFRGQLILTLISVGLFYTLINSGLIALQGLIDTHFPAQAALSAIGLMLLMQGLSLLNIAFSMIMLVYLATEQLNKLGLLPDIEFPTLKNHKILRFTFLITVFLFCFLFIAAAFLSDREYIESNTLSNPILISHRGVSEENGVQNTIPALITTSTQLHPDFVEIDIQETSDKQFVVLHDASTKALTGKNWLASQHTLSELTALTAHENGHSAALASFDDYLTEAEKLHQKLLVEVKVYKGSASQISTNFSAKYAKRLIKDNSRVHTLNFTVVQDLKKISPKLNVAYIMPYNALGVPATSANAFSVEVSTLTNAFVTAAQAQKKEVYAWDVDDSDTAQKLRYYEVNGLITDDIQLIRQTINNRKQLSYSHKLKIYFIDLSDNNFIVFKNNDTV